MSLTLQKCEGPQHKRKSALECPGVSWRDQMSAGPRAQCGTKKVQGEAGSEGMVSEITGD